MEPCRGDCLVLRHRRSMRPSITATQNEPRAVREASTDRLVCAGLLVEGWAIYVSLVSGLLRNQRSSKDHVSRDLNSRSPCGVRASGSTESEDSENAVKQLVRW
jgi:hypothetical protein